MKTYALSTLLAVAALGVQGCSRSESGPAGAGSTASSAALAKTGKSGPRYPLTGEVLSVDTEKKTLRVRHEEIKGYMPAMTMDFAVSAGDAAAAKAGQRIRAELIPSTDGGDFHLENIWPDDKVGADTIDAAAKQLREDTHNRGKGAYRELGETVPRFALYDQDGRVVQSDRFRGKQLMINFIFTRCPVANMCPASTAKMMALQQQAREAGVKNLEILSITLDPAYDTPGVLKDYAVARGIDTGNFSFLTGPETAIKDLFAQFGIISEFKGDILQHNLATLLVNGDGQIIHREDGSQWEPRNFVARMTKS